MVAVPVSENLVLPPMATRGGRAGLLRDPGRKERMNAVLGRGLYFRNGDASGNGEDLDTLKRK